MKRAIRSAWIVVLFGFVAPLGGPAVLLATDASVAGGCYHTLALSEDGTVWAWGTNWYGQLGDGTTTQRMTPAQVQNLSNASAIASGFSHSMALKTDGSVWAWGDNWSGQLGDGTTTNRTTPVQVQSLSNATAISGGYNYSLALTTDGTVWAWGDNYYGELGDGTTTQRTAPVQVQNLSGVVAIRGGYDHSLALKADGTVWAWGRNVYGQLGDGTTTNRTTPVQVQNLSGVTAIAGGAYHSLALKSDGAVWTWGNNAWGQLGDGTTTNRTTPVQVQNLANVAAIASQETHSLALKTDGSVWAWGYNWYGQLGDGTWTDRTTPMQVQNLSGVRAIAGGVYHSLALKADGTVWAWGWNSWGQLGDGTTNQRMTPAQVQNLSNASAIASGSSHSLALKTDGTVWAWGYNEYGALGDGTTTRRASAVQVQNLGNAAVIAGGNTHSLAIKTDGTVWAWGVNWSGQLGDGTTTNRTMPVQVQSLSNATAISGGYGHSLALKTDGTVWAWGYNGYGQLGDGTTTQRTTPVQVQNLTNVAATTGGFFHSLALKTDGTVWAWGYNGYGQLGDGTTTDRTTPVQVQNLTNVAAIAGGPYHSLALKTDGTVWAWGPNWYGQLGDGTTTDRTTPVQVQNLTNVAAIAGGFYHSLALKTDGTVWAWGYNGYGELGDGTITDRTTPVQVESLSDVLGIAGGDAHSLALKTNGIGWAWGSNEYGQLGDGSNVKYTVPGQVLGQGGEGYLYLIYVDSDNDDLPDWWELAHFPDLSQGRNGDYDGDGFSNYLEYVFNSDPNNPNEVPPSSDLYQDADYGYAEDEQEGGAGLVAGSIRIVSGNAVESREDLSFPSPNSLGLSFRATYNSRLAQGGILGYGWTHTYSATLNPAFQMGDRAFLKILDGTGKASYFVEEGSGNYSGVFGERTYVKAEGGGYVWYRVDGTRMSFNSSGKLTSIRDEKGNSIDLTYNGQGNPQTATDGASSRTVTFYYNNNLLDHITGPVTAAVDDGIWVTYGYDGNQNLTTVTYADGSGYSYVYNDGNDIHNLTQKKDLLNHILREWSYNSSDQATAALTPDGKGVTLITYGDTQAQVRDVYNISRTYTLAKMDGRKKVTALTGITNAPYTESNALRWVYDDRSRLTEVEYGGGAINRYQNYDERGNPGTVILAYGSADQRTIQYTFHPEMNVPLTRTESSALGSGNKVTIWDYDNDYNATANQAPTRLLSRLIEQGYTGDMNGTVTSYEYITTFTYNAKGQVLSVDGPRSGSGDTTTFSYNANTGNLESVTQPIIGSTAFTEYDAAGRPGRVTDVNGQQKGFTYDGRGRVTAVTNYADSPASSTQFAYLGGLLDTVTDPDGVSQFFGYDGFGRLSTIADEEGDYISHTYESYPRGNLTEKSKYTSSQTRTSRNRWSYEQPSYPGKLYREIQADDTFREYDYDSAGNMIWAKDPKGYTTTFGYDFMNRLESVAQRVNDPNPRDLVTSYAYDAHGNLISVTDAKSNETIYDYDDMGRVVSTDSPDTGIQSTAYDQAGNLRYKTDAKSVRVEYTYDNLNRVTAAIYPDSVDDIAYTYDQGTNGKGHLTTMEDPSGLIGFGYDSRGRLTQKTSTISGVNYPVTYVYTPGGKVGSVTYPSGRVITYDRNALGKISEVTASGIVNPLASGLTYRPFGGPLGLTNGFGGTVNNQAGECDCVTVSNPGQPRERSYGNDPNRNLTSITGTTTPWYSQTLGYDQLNRLNSATGRYGSIAYTYDDVGNRLTRNTNGTAETYTYVTGTNRLHQITGGASPRTFSYDSNGNISGDGTLTFIYDQSNQLVEVEQGANSLAEYTYNGLGQRVVKQAGVNTTVYHYDLDGKLIAESLPNGTMTREYLYMGKVRVAMVDVAGGNALYHYLNDRLGTPEILTNGSGTVVWEAWYEPFGEAHIHPSSSVANNIRLPGQYHDSETGLYYNYHRYYDPRSGRYVTADPIGLEGGINLYAYVQNTPVNLTDPEGLWALISCTRCGQSGALTCKVMEDGFYTDQFITNAWKNVVSKTPGNPYGYKGPLPPGTFDVPNDDSPGFHRRLPSPTNTGVPGVVKTPKGKLRDGIRVHGGEYSEGCLTLGPGEQGKKLEQSLTDLVDRHSGRGRTILTITEVDCCE